VIKWIFENTVLHGEVRAAGGQDREGVSGHHAWSFMDGMNREKLEGTAKGGALGR